MHDIASRIASDLGVSELQIRETVISAPSSYKKYFIRKANGGRREVAHPRRELKVIQRWLSASIFERLPIHESATAYMKGASIRKNAEAHLRNKFLLKIDFRNFFTSIKEADISLLLNAHMHLLEVSATDVEFIARACCIKTKNGKYVMPIGAPSSPYLCNAIMYDFDLLISEICRSLNVTYTRYADDMTFSTNTPDVLKQIGPIVRSCLNKTRLPHLKINQQKTVNTSKKRLRMVTGVVLTSENKLSIGREKKRYLRAMIHKYSLGKLPDQDIQRTKGLFSYAISIEPSLRDSLARKFGKDLILSLY